MQEQKGDMHNGHSNGVKVGSTGNGGLNKLSNFGGMKGHKEMQCVRKFPEKAPAWWKEKNAKTKSASSNNEFSLTSFTDPAN